MKSIFVLCSFLFLFSCGNSNSSDDTFKISRPGDQYLGAWQDVRDNWDEDSDLTGFEQIKAQRIIYVHRNGDGDDYIYTHTNGKRYSAFYEHGNMVIRSGIFKVSLFYDQHMGTLTDGTNKYKKI